MVIFPELSRRTMHGHANRDPRFVFVDAGGESLAMAHGTSIRRADGEKFSSVFKLVSRVALARNSPVTSVQYGIDIGGATGYNRSRFPVNPFPPARQMCGSEVGLCPVVGVRIASCWMMSIFAPT